MSLLVGGIVQLLHVGLLVVAVPVLLGFIGSLQARLAGHAGPPLAQPWNELRRLLRKQTIQAESASCAGLIALPLAAAATLTVACLVPSFSFGMLLMPLADLPTVATLLLLARVSSALAAMDAGSAGGGMGASRIMLLGCLAEPALLLVAFVLSLLAGNSNLAVIAASQSEAFGWRASVALACAATVLLVLVDLTRRRAPTTEYSGRDLALVEGTEALRLLVWFDLLGAIFLPYGTAPATAGPAEWPLGVAVWLLRTLLFAVILACGRASLGRMPLQRAVQVLGVAAVLGLLAIAFLFAGTSTA